MPKDHFPDPASELSALRALLKEKEAIIGVYQRLHELTISERQEADSIISAHESVEALARREIEQLHQTILAHERVEGLAYTEIDLLLKTVTAQEKNQELARQELLDLHNRIKAEKAELLPDHTMDRELLDAEKTIKAFENLQEFQNRQFRYYDQLIEAYENVGAHFGSEIKQLRQIVRAHEAVEELARKEMMTLHSTKDEELKNKDSLISELNRQLVNSERTLDALDAIMDHQRQTKLDLDRTIEAYKSLSQLSNQELDTAYRTIRVHEELEKLAWQEKEAVDRDLIRAQKMQQNLLQDRLRSGDGFPVCARYIPSNRLGGDFYAIKMVRQGRISILMSDAAGHGSQAALVAAIVKTLFEEYAPRYVNPGIMLARLNSGLYNILKNVRTFITAVSIVIDPDRKQLVYSNGGHPYAWIIRSDGDILELGQTGSLLGAFTEVSFRRRTVRLNPGDMLFLFTDGIVESLGDNEEEFGTDRLKRLVTDHRQEDPEQIFKRIEEELISFHGSSRFEDDVTLLAVKME